MQFIRRRYYFWLIKAYFKRWNKTIISSIIFGSVFFFVIAFALNFYILPRIQKRVQKIGYAGAFTLKTIPPEILSDVSYGLTLLNRDQTIAPGAAYKWQIKDEGREYLIYLKKGQYFHDNRELTTKNLTTSFKDVEKHTLDDYTVLFKLKKAYAPFLTSLSVPIITKNLDGLGKYKISKVEMNAGFIKSLTLTKRDDPKVKKIIYFYPSEEALRIAYSLGEIDVSNGLKSINIKNRTFESFNNTKITRTVNYTRLLTAFYNNTDANLSNKKVRQALNYALPATFEEGERSFSPIPKSSHYFSTPPNYGIVDPGIARELITQEKELKSKVLEISVHEAHVDTAEEIQKAWEKVGVKTKIKVVNNMPTSFQVLIYPMNLPNDPDQYTLWHSGEVNNIAKYKNLRIDKILEDGRFISDKNRRQEIYQDFQKYLIDDVPASFLYFPYEYELSRT